MKKAFLDKYYPEEISARRKEEIKNVEQKDDEDFADYWERFNKMCAECPYHGFEEQHLILYFTGGLNDEEVKMVHTASGGSILNKTPEEATILLQNLAKESKSQWRRKSTEQIPKVKNTKMELTKKIDDLTSLVKTIASKSDEEKPRSLSEFNSFSNPFMDENLELKEYEKREHVNFVNFHMGNHTEERKRSSPIRIFKPRVSK